MNRFIISLILCTTLALPLAAHAAPLCSDGTPAPAGNICNCGTNASLSSSFTPGSNTGLTGSTYGNGGFQFSGVGGALTSCLNVGSAVSDLVKTFADKYGIDDGEDSSTQKIPVNDKKTSSNSKTTADEEKKTTRREQCLNGIAYAVAKTALQKVSNKTLNWVRTGLNGNPLYVRDIDSYLGTIKNEKINSYVNDYIGNNNPIFGNALRSIIKQQTTGYSDNLLNKTMNTPEGKAYQDFQADFTNGGWASLLDQNNNSVGAYFSATDQLKSIVNNAQQNVQNELQQGNGFLNLKKCVEYTADNDNPSYSANDAQQCLETYQGQKHDALVACGSLTSPTYAACKAQADATYDPLITSCQQHQTILDPKSAKCVRYENVTPGSLISTQVSDITGSVVRQLENADQINEVLGSFFDQLLNRLFSDGLTGTGQGTSRGSSGVGPGTNVVIGTNGNTLATATACQTPLGYNPTTGGFSDEFDISRPQQLRAIIETQRSFLTRSQDTQFKMQELVPKLGALDYCIPGPNPSWNVNLNDNAGTFVSSLQEVRQKDNNVLVTITHILDPGHVFCGIFSNSSNCTNENRIVGYTTSRVSLLDKVDGGLKRISDRAYSTNDTTTQDVISYYFSDILEKLKATLSGSYSETALTSAFLSNATSATDIAYVPGFVKDALTETGNLIGYAQGVAGYNQQYTLAIQNTKDAIAELESIDREVEELVAGAKARYIQDMQTAGTPVNQSCLDNAYRVDTNGAGPGLPHLIDITAAPDASIQKSKDVSTYFYNRL